MTDREVPGENRRKRIHTVMTYSKSIPQFLMVDLGITELPAAITEAMETTLGKVTITRLARRHFEEQMTILQKTYNDMPIEERVAWAQAVRRNDREITLSTEIQHHPHVTKICGFIVEREREQHVEDTSEDILAIVTEYAPGGTAEQFLKNRRLDNNEVYSWALQLARTMAYFHDKLSIMHRDIRPENILVFEGGKLIKLGNFHYAVKSTNDQQQRSSRNDPNVIYCAPEAIAEIVGRYGLSVDVWSFGVFLYYITHVDASGNPRVPFPLRNNEGVFAFRKRLEEGEVNRLTLEPTLHPVFAQLIESCIVLETRGFDHSSRTNFSDIVAKLERNRAQFDVTEVL